MHSLGHGDILARYSNNLEHLNLAANLQKRLGSLDQKNILIKGTDGLCTWALEMMGRLNYFSYPFNDKRVDIEVALSEIIAGMVFIYWRQMSPVQKNYALQGIVECIWREPRSSARSLLIIAAACLQQREVADVYELLSRKIRSAGLRNFESGVLAYVTARLAFSDDIEPAQSKLLSLSMLVSDPRSTVPKELKESTVATLDCLADLDRPSVDPRGAIDALGLPNRDHRHPYLFALLNDVGEEKYKGNEVDALFELATFLDPVHAFVSARRDLFESFNVFDELHDVFTEFNKAVLGKPLSREGLVDFEACRRVCKQIHRFLLLDVYGKKSVSSILAERFLHYLPYRVRKVVFDLTSETRQTGPVIKSTDFAIEAEISVAERELFSRSLDETKRLEIVQGLLKNDVVLVDSVDLDGVLRDTLLDIKHPKYAGANLGDGSSMHVSFGRLERRHGSRDYNLEVKFENIATESQAASARGGRSWNLTELKMSRINGFAELKYSQSNQTLTRSLWFPAIGRRS